jgi:hypothetical protein
MDKWGWGFDYLLWAVIGFFFALSCLRKDWYAIIAMIVIWILVFVRK